jgi:hypothetical protein
VHDVHALETVPGCTPAPPRTTSRMHSTRHGRSSPPHRLHRLPTSSVPPSPLESSDLPYSAASPSPPPASAARAMAVPHCQRRLYCLLAHQTRLQRAAPVRPRTRFSASSTRHRPPLTCSAHGAAAPYRPYRVDHLPRAATVSSALSPSARSELHHRIAAAGVNRPPCGIASPCAAPILCADAGLRSKPRPAVHREHDTL